MRTQSDAQPHPRTPIPSHLAPTMHCGGRQVRTSQADEPVAKVSVASQGVAMPQASLAGTLGLETAVRDRIPVVRKGSLLTSEQTQLRPLIFWTGLHPVTMCITQMPPDFLVHHCAVLSEKMSVASFTVTFGSLLSHVSLFSTSALAELSIAVHLLQDVSHVLSYTKSTVPF